MSRTKQKRVSKVQSRKALIIGIVLATVVVFVASYTAWKHIEQSRKLQQQKDTLISALNETEKVYYAFADDISYPKELTKKPVNECVKSGAKYSMDYECGNEARLIINDINEAQYRKINQQLLDIYRDNGSFSAIDFMEPRETKLDSGLTSMISSRFQDSSMWCSVTSNYLAGQQRASLFMTCHQTLGEKIFPESS